jgi:hypothetical protein
MPHHSRTLAFVAAFVVLDTVAATKVAKLRVSLVCRGLGKGGKKETLAERSQAKMFFKTLEMTNSSTFEPIRRLICVPLSCRPADGQHAEHHLLEPTVTCMQKYENSIPNYSRSKRSNVVLHQPPSSAGRRSTPSTPTEC